MKKQTKQKTLVRDQNIQLSHTREINMNTRSVESKKKYNRTEKHKKSLVPTRY